MLSDCLVVRADIIVTVLPVRAPGNFMCGFESFCVSAEGSSQTAEICGKRSRVVSHKNKPTCNTNPIKVESGFGLLVASYRHFNASCRHRGEAFFTLHRKWLFPHILLLILCFV